MRIGPVPGWQAVEAGGRTRAPDDWDWCSQARVLRAAHPLRSADESGNNLAADDDLRLLWTLLRRLASPRSAHGRRNDEDQSPRPGYRVSAGSRCSSISGSRTGRVDGCAGGTPVTAPNTPPRCSTPATPRNTIPSTVRSTDVPRCQLRSCGLIQYAQTSVANAARPARP